MADKKVEVEAEEVTEAEPADVEAAEVEPVETVEEKTDELAAEFKAEAHREIPALKNELTYYEQLGDEDRAAEVRAQLAARGVETADARPSESR